MVDWVSRITDLTKIPIKFFAVAAILSGALVLLPDEFIRQLALSKFVNEFGAYISIVFLACTALLIVEAALRSYRFIRLKISKKTLSKEIRRKIEHLDSSEASVIREFLLDGNSTATLPIDHPAVAELLDKNVLTMIGGLGHRSTVGMLCSLRLTEVARENLKPDHIGLRQFLIDSPGDNFMLNDAGIHWVRENRPSFVQKIEEDRALFEGRLF